jgi:hypothetical protein
MTKTSAVTALVIVLAATFVAASPSVARNTQYMFKIADAVKDPTLAAEVPIDVTFYYAQQQPPQAGPSLGDAEVQIKRKKPSQSDEVNCRLAFVAALNELRSKAVAVGGNAVSGIVSYYKKNVSGTDTDYECHAGATGGVVALKGTILKVAR